MLTPTALLAQATWVLESTTPTARAQAAIAADTAGKIYLFGGYDEGGSAFNTVSIYDTVTDTWSTGPTMPQPTRGASAVHYNNNIYVIGGYNSGQHNLVQILNLATSTWTQVTLPGSGWETSAAVVGSQIIVVGGESNTLQTFSFDPANSTTTTLANNPNGSLASQVAVIDSKLYLIGATSTYTPGNTQLDMFTPLTNTWSTTPADDTLARTQFAAVSDGTYLYVMGGSNTASNNSSPFYSDTRIYTPGTDTWSNGPSLPLGLRETAAVYVNGTIYLAGGFSASGVSSSLYALQTIPEPATVALLGLGLLLLRLHGWRRR